MQTTIDRPSSQRVKAERAIRPGRGQPRLDLRRQATQQQSAGDREAAVASLIAAVQRQPRDADLHAALASSLTELGRFGEAIGAGMMAVECAPGSARAHAELGRALFLSGQAEAALPVCAQAVVLAPSNLGAIVTFGAVLFTLGRHEAALEAAREAVAIDPQHFQARGNLALALEALGRLDEAEAQSRRALALDPESVPGRHNLAALRLSRGKLDAETWRLYEARLGLTAASRALEAVPRWAGEDIAGKTVLLHAEQGLGDTIQFVRYAPMVAARGARVIVAAQAPLVRLLQGAPGVDQVVQAGVRLPPFDVFCPVASLPGILGTTIESIPASASYLHARPAEAAHFRPPPVRALQVGLVWAGNPDFVHDRLRSIDARAFRLLEDVRGVVFHSLQKGGTPPFPMEDRMEEAADFADTAGLVAGLDLVIAVDTAVAHLAGAMGKEVWLLSRHMGCWRWLRDRADTPWYPSMRLFRQPRSGDWAAVLAEVQEALVDRVMRGRHLP